MGFEAHIWDVTDERTLLGIYANPVMKAYKSFHELIVHEPVDQPCISVMSVRQMYRLYVHLYMPNNVYIVRTRCPTCYE